MKNTSLGSGLLSVFRVFVLVRLIFAVFPLVADQVLPRFRFQRIPTLFLCGYLRSAALTGLSFLALAENRLGKWYIPIALGIATLAPILENFLALDLRFDEISQVRAFAGQWQLVIFLLLP